MARKVKEAAAVAAPGADDLEVLHPEREVTIAGRKLVVREYGFVEGLQLRPLYKPIIDSLKPALAEGELPELEDVLDLLAVHANALPDLIAASCDQPVEWVARHLGLEAGHNLMLVWWGVNGPFFVRSAAGQLLSERVRALGRAGATSTQP